MSAGEPYPCLRHEIMLGVHRISRMGRDSNFIDSSKPLEILSTIIILRLGGGIYA